MATDYLDKLLSGGEVALVEAKQHPIAVVKFALKPILLVVLVIGLLLFNQIFDFDGFLEILNEFARYALIIVAIIAAIWLPIDIVQWYSRRYVLTNRRVIRMYGVVSKNSFDSSLEQINDIQSEQSAFGRLFHYTNLTIYTASDATNESYEQIIDGLQFKKAILSAKEAIRKGVPLMALPDDFVVRGGTNEASIRAYQKQPEAPAAPSAATATTSEAPGTQDDVSDVPGGSAGAPLTSSVDAPVEPAKDEADEGARPAGS